MTEVTTITGDNKRRFDVELFIVHPLMKPDKITDALGLKPSIVHGIGARRRTPKGKLLKGKYSDTRWRFSERHIVEDQWFASYLAKLVKRLTPRKKFLRKIISGGGSACVLVQFLGDGYFGDTIEPSTLKQLADLGVRFGIECYIVPQRPWLK